MGMLASRPRKANPTWMRRIERLCTALDQSHATAPTTMATTATCHSNALNRSLPSESVIRGRGGRLADVIVTAQDPVGSLFGVFHMLHLSDGYATFVSWPRSPPNPRP